MRLEIERRTRLHGADRSIGRFIEHGVPAVAALFQDVSLAQRDLRLGHVPWMEASPGSRSSIPYLRGGQAIRDGRTSFDKLRSATFSDEVGRSGAHWLAHTMRATHSTSSAAKIRSACCALSAFSSSVLAVLRLSSLAITSPPLALTMTRSPRRIAAAGDTMTMVPSR